jgi:hypothetical protein
MLAGVRALRGMDAVKRVTLPIAVVVVLAFPGSALATTFFKGPVNGGANNAGVEFRAKIKHGEPKKVLEFRWFNVPVPPNCADSFEGLHFEMSVNDRRKFHGKYSVPHTDHVATVHGKFKHQNEKATGTIELKGSFAGGCSADTGELPWTADRAGT